jgi:uncharacterized protein YjbJ (UPF0337 family)
MRHQLVRGRPAAWVHRSDNSHQKENVMNTTPSATRQKWEGRWDQLVGRAKQFWGDLTDDDVTRAKGDYEELIGVIKERTGKTREEIHKALDS